MTPPTGPFAAIDDARDRIAREHPRWHAAHLIAAMLFGFSYGLGITPLEVGGIPLMLVTVLRFGQTRRLYAALLREPVVLALLAFVAWALLALSWSLNRSHGLDEIGSVRWLWVFVAIWPIADRRLPVIAALAAGMFTLHGSQVGQLIGQRYGIPELTWGQFPDRIAGWGGPVVTGSLLSGVFGLHAAAAVLGRGRVAWIARALTLVTGVALIATGTRGAWLAAMALLGTLGLVAVITHRRSIGVRQVLIAAGVAAVVAATAWFTIGDAITSRISDGWKEVRDAFESEDYYSSTGGRIIMWYWAWEAVKAEPVTGVGTGGYRAWVNERQTERGIDPATQRVLDHAHGSAVHVAAVQGLIGLTLFATLCILVLRRSWVPPTLVTRGEAHPYDLGLFFGVLGLLLAGVLDSVHINAQSSALLALLTALSLGLARRRPATRAGRSPLA
ncbi:MAG: O-antigen ligase family protein [Planctomycetota bacterium]